MPVVTTAALTLLGKHLAEKGLEKAFENGADEASKSAINWIKKLFTKDGKDRQELVDLAEKIESPARINAVNAILEREFEDNLEAIKYFKLLENLIAVPNIVINNKNVNSGTINSGGGNVHLGDQHGK